MACDANTILEGEAAIVTLTYVDSAGDPTDPTSITAVVQDPSGDQATYTKASAELVSSVVGTWVLTVPESTETGEWVCNVSADSGGKTEIVETTWHMLASAVA